MDQGDRLHPSFGLETDLKITTLAVRSRSNSVDGSRQQEANFHGDA
jgi:hypothetical protein